MFPKRTEPGRLICRRSYSEMLRGGARHHLHPGGTDADHRGARSEAGHRDGDQFQQGWGSGGYGRSDRSKSFNNDNGGGNKNFRNFRKNDGFNNSWQKKNYACPASSGSGKVPSSAGVALDCFKCGRPGHYIANFPNPPLCFLCKSKGHSASECTSRAMAPLLKMTGHGIQGDVFFHLELPEKEVDPVGSNPALIASILLESGSISMEALVAELNCLMEIDDWDWGISLVSHKEFLVRFPNKQSLRLCRNNGGMKVPLSKIMVLFTEPTADTEVCYTLQEVWAKF